MAILKKNIWSLFYFLIIIGLAILITSIYSTSKHIENEYIQKQKALLKTSSAAIYSTFIQQEMLLDILGEQLTQNENYKSLDKSRKILDNLLILDSPIAAFGLAKPNGELYVTSSNLKDIKKLPNLLEKKETKESFKYALDKDYMVVGRTYYHKVLESLVIPIRKAIKDKSGNTIAVMTAGINVNKAFNTIPKSTLIFRELDYYNQITEIRDDSKLEVYNFPIPKENIELIKRSVEKKYKTSIEEIKNEERAISINLVRHHQKSEVLSTLKYIKRYKLWIVNQNKMENFYKDIIEESIIFAVTFFVLMLVLYYLFRIIDNFEKQKQKALYHQATHDYLTNLHNRLYLSNIFEKDFNAYKNKSFSLLFIDMDNFKSINDNYGHNYGDEILKKISQRLQSFKKPKDVLVRYSGDEFILIVFETKKDKIKKLASDIIQRVSEPYPIDHYQFILGASIGISQYPIDGKNFDEIKRYADIAMYEAKKEKNTYCIFEDSIKHKYLKSSLIEHELKTAVENSEIYMAYQPQIDKNGELYGVEALVRWENEKLGFVPPDQFIKIAEASGLMSKLGEHIIKTSLSDIQTIQKQINKKFQLSINISVKQFMEPNFYENLFAIVEKINFDRLKITLEVTENVFIEDLDFIINLLNKIKKQNVKISLDDFGTGYSSLSLLKKLPVDELKIDKSFIDDILFDKSSESMVESIISIGKNFDMLIVAEGIESKEQEQKLTNLDCDLFQGYLYSKPLKKEDLLAYIKNYH